MNVVLPQDDAVLQIGFFGAPGFAGLAPLLFQENGVTLRITVLQFTP